MNNIAQFPIPFVKMSGTGNDFILIDHRQPFIAADAMSSLATAICRRKFSVGADGLILLENSEKADFSWQFFNADGSVAEMCGNGARCAARFAFMKGIAPAKMSFETLAGIIEAEVSASDVAVKMTEPIDLCLQQTIQVNNAPLTLHSINTGVPHAVVFVDNITETDVRALGQEIRYHEAFAPAGTNVNFVQKIDNSFKVRTYERGVEDETLACGTGAAASAIIASVLGQASSPVDIITSGGDLLTIVFTCDPGSQAIRDVYLQGPVRVIYAGELNSESLL